MVDVQEGFRPYATFVRGRGGRLREARAGGAHPRRPALVSEQYPKGLGHTAPEVGLEDEPRIEKTVFSAARADGFDLGGRDQAIVCGIEAHVCVSQTVHDLLDRASKSTSPPTRSARATRSTTSAAWSAWSARARSSAPSRRSLFELLERAGTPEFKAVQKLIL